MARLKHLYSYGYDNYAICAILKEEFQDIEVNDITLSLIDKLIKENKKMLEQYKEDLAQECTAIQKQETQALFIKAGRADHKAAGVLINKMDDIINQIIVLRLDITDDAEREKNYSIYNGLLSVLEKTQQMYSKIAGTNAYREIELFRMRKDIEAQYKSAGGTGPLIPAEPASGGGTMPEVTG